MAMTSAQAAVAMPATLVGNRGRLGLGATPKASRKRKAADGVAVEKTAYSVLHERYPVVAQLIKWESVVSPTTQQPVFRCSASIENVLYCGEAASKKDAKHKMAEHALHSLMPAGAPPLYAKSPAGAQPQPWPSSQGEEVAAKTVVQSMAGRLHSLCMTKGPEWIPLYTFEDVKDSEDTKQHDIRYKCILKCSDEERSAIAMSKRLAKKDAAKQMLSDVFQVPADELKDDEEAAPLPPVSEVGPIQALHERCMRKGIKPVWSNMAVGEQTHEAVVKLEDGEKFKGVGSSRKEARTKAACAALQTVFGVELNADDFVKQRIKLDAIMRSPAETKPPPLLLNELCQMQGGERGSVAYEFEPSSPPDGERGPYFVAKASIGQQTFEGGGRNKKLAKCQAARAVLLNVFEVRTPEPTALLSVGVERRASTSEGGAESAFATSAPPQVAAYTATSIADLVSSLVRNKYLQLCTETRQPPTCYMSGVVMTSGETLNSGTVVSLAAGAQHLASGQALGTAGLVLIDCHAQVLARRGLLLFLYQQLEMLRDSRTVPTSILEAVPDGGGGGYRVKPNIKFHFYSTLTPPGDARVRVARDPATLVGAEGAVPSKGGGDLRDECLLRCYSDLGGSAPTGDSTPPSWDDLRSGAQPLHVMSVSDKMLKWNMLGVQGALLSRFVQPIYLESIVIGSAFYREPLVRAVYGRAAAVARTAADAPQPSVLAVSHPEQLVGRPRPPDTSVAWTAAQSGVEFIAHDTGRDITGQPSRFCKERLFHEFGHFARSLRPIEEHGGEWTTYAEAKRLSKRYDESKRELLRALDDAGFGKWMRKPEEIEQFNLPYCD